MDLGAWLKSAPRLHRQSSLGDWAATRLQPNCRRLDVTRWTGWHEGPANPLLGATGRTPPITPTSSAGQRPDSLSMRVAAVIRATAHPEAAGPQPVMVMRRIPGPTLVCTSPPLSEPALSRARSITQICD